MLNIYKYVTKHYHIVDISNSIKSISNNIWISISDIVKALNGETMLYIMREH